MTFDEFKKKGSKFERFDHGCWTTISKVWQRVLLQAGDKIGRRRLTHILLDFKNLALNLIITQIPIIKLTAKWFKRVLHALMKLQQLEQQIL